MLVLANWSAQTHTDRINAESCPDLTGRPAGLSGSRNGVCIKAICPE